MISFGRISTNHTFNVKWNQNKSRKWNQQIVLNVALKEQKQKNKIKKKLEMHTRIHTLIINENPAWKWIMIALRCN